MKIAKILTCSLILLLVVGGRSSASASTQQFTIPSQDVQLSKSYYEYVQILTISNTSTVDFVVNSNVTISTALMTSGQFSQWNSSTNYNISNSVFDENSTSVNESIKVANGTFYLVMYAYSAPANVTFDYQTYPVSPFENGDLYPPKPTGIASFGLYNESGNVVPYSIKTNELVGVVNISSIEAYNSTASSVNASVYGATLQLNSMFVVVNKDGSEYTYWAQNTPDFVTNDRQIAFGDNVWNASDTNGPLSNQSITSSTQYGAVFTTTINGTRTDYYGFETRNSTFGSPLDLALLMNESVVKNVGVLVQMGIQVQRNGSFILPSSITWFDNITVHDPNVQDAYFYISGNETTPQLTFYDAELVFCGENSGESTSFTQMNASLALYYYSKGALSSFPSYYSFGFDTAESADNLQVSYSSNGIATVSVGTPAYDYLGIANSTYILPTPTVQKTTTSATSVVTKSTSDTTSSSTSSSTTSATSSTSYSSVVSSTSVVSTTTQQVTTTTTTSSTAVVTTTTSQQGTTTTSSSQITSTSLGSLTYLLVGGIVIAAILGGMFLRKR